jgi:hypothetical protein
VGRVAAVLVLLAALLAWFETAPHLGALSTWWSVVFVAVVLMPAMFGLTWLALPFRDRLVELAVALGCFVVAALVLSLAGAPVLANFAKFGAVTAAGFLFLHAFEALSWVVTVAFVIPWVDAYSVWRGPTQNITAHHPAVFTKLSIGFVVPGGNAARLGLPDVLFFTVFLAASARFGLRPLATWIAMLVGLGITMTATTFWANGGLPALPAISVGFLVANGDLLWRRLSRPRLGSPETG